MVYYLSAGRAAGVSHVCAGRAVADMDARAHGGTAAHAAAGNRAQVGADLYHAGNFRRRVLCLLPSVLQHQLWRCVLGVGTHPALFCGAGCFL